MTAICRSLKYEVLCRHAAKPGTDGFRVTALITGIVIMGIQGYVRGHDTLECADIQRQEQQAK